MMLGLSLAAFTQLHVAISLIAIAAGLVFFFALGLGRGSWLGWANGVFLVATILTSVTGFLFPPKPIGPPFVFGVISLAVLAVTLLALYGARLRGWWRAIFLATALVAQWLNMVVLVVQSFQKIDALNALAPTGAEPPVLAGQALVVLVLGYLGWKALRSRALPG